jgi:sucrose-6-phosphate hydrolase SacC (GH32 family)
MLVCHVQVVFEGLDPDTRQYSLSSPTARRVGGRLEPRGLQTLSLRIILDCSLLEVFAGSGQVITTRVYRGTPPSPQDSGIDLLSIGGVTGVARLNAWELSTIWAAPQVLRLHG